MPLFLDPYTVEELIDMLLKLIDFSTLESKSKMQQFVYGLVNSDKRENLKLAAKLSQKTLTGNSKLDDIQQVHMFFQYIKIWAEHFADSEKSLLYQIWRIRNTNSTDQSSAESQIIHIFEEFLNAQNDLSVFTVRLYTRLLEQLESTSSNDPRVGHFLLSKLLDSTKPDAIESNENFNELHFHAYLTMLQCVEVESVPRRSLKEDKYGLVWMRPLYVRLLKEDNLLVLRWTLEYLMEHVTMNELSRANLLLEFLAATNRTDLHDFDNYALPEQQMKKFILERKQFLMAFSRIPWLEIPLVRWLSCVEPKRIQLTQKLLLQYATLVNKIQNTTLRSWACDHIFKIFQFTIDKLSLCDYLDFIGTFVGKSNEVWNEAFDGLIKKIQDCQNLDDQIVHLKPHQFEAICHKYIDTIDPYRDLLKKLKQVPKSRRGWWRLSVLFKVKDTPEGIGFYRSEYNINMKLFDKCEDLNDLQVHLLDKLDCNTEAEKQFVLQQSVDTYVPANLKDWKQLEELHLNAVELLQSGTHVTFMHMSRLLRDSSLEIQDKTILSTFVELWKQDSGNWRSTRHILDYAAEHLEITELEDLVEDMILSCGKDLAKLDCVLSTTTLVPKALLIQELIYEESEVEVDNSNIEIALEAHLHVSKTRRRDYFIKYLLNMSKNNLTELLSELLLINGNISSTALIAENSTEHRIQIRIARVILQSCYLAKALPADQLWQALLAPSNQLNINYSYECILAKQLTTKHFTFQMLLEKLKKLHSLLPDQQDSIISVIYSFCMINWKHLKMVHYEKIFELLSQQFEHLNKQSQIFLELVLHQLAVKWEEHSENLPVESLMKLTPNFSFEDKTLQFLIETRLMLPTITNDFSAADIILHITNAPSDEYYFRVFDSLPYRQDLLEQIRKAFKSGKCQSRELS